MQTITYAAHTAHLDLTGEGILVLPHLADDLDIETGIDSRSLHWTDYARAIADLDKLGFEPTEGEGGEPTCFAGVTAEGRDVIGLCGRDPIIADPSLHEMALASAELAALVGLVPEAR